MNARTEHPVEHVKPETHITVSNMRVGKDIRRPKGPGAHSSVKLVVNGKLFCPYGFLYHLESSMSEDCFSLRVT